MIAERMPGHCVTGLQLSDQSLRGKPVPRVHPKHIRTVRVEFVFTNLRTDRVGGNARAKSESWVKGRVDGDAQICDLVVVAEHVLLAARGGNGLFGKSENRVV